MSQINSGLDIGSMFRTATQGLDTDSKALQTKIDSISNSKEINQKELLEIQFAMGQYNAKIETLSSVTKSIQDMLKSLAQRTG